MRRAVLLLMLLASGGSASADRKAAARDPRLEKASHLRHLYNRRDVLMEEALRRPIDVPGTLHRLTGEILRQPVFAAELPRGAKGKQLLRSGASIAFDARLIAKRARHPQVRQIYEILADFAESRQIYTREGTAGVADLLDDPIVRQAVGPKIARTLRLNDEKVELALDAASVLPEGLSLHEVGGRKTEALPLELQLLYARRPETARAIAALHARGVPIRLEKLHTTPGSVLDAIKTIAVVTQENYTTTWLRDLVDRGQRPDLKPTPNGLQRARTFGLVPESGELDRGKLEAALGDIEVAADQYLRFTVGKNAAGVTDQSPEIRALNQALRPIGREWARRRLIQDNAHDRTHGAQEVIKKMLFLGPAAHGLEMLHLGPAAKFLTGSFDDILGEIAELKALHGSGYSKPELWKRAKVLVPVGVGAAAASLGSHYVIEWDHVVGGAVFGGSAVALSLTTAYLSIGMYEKGYEELLRHGKIPEKAGPLMTPEFRAQMKQLKRELGTLLDPKHKPALLAKVGQALDGQVASGQLTRAEADQMLDELARLDIRKLVDRVSMPGKLSRKWEALKQDFSNPARAGIAFGAVLAPLFGMAAGAAGGLDNGFVLAAVGSTESIVAGSTVHGARKFQAMRYNRWLKHQLDEARRSSGQSPGSNDDR